MSKTMTLYMDESGNAGTNWIDQTQPYFVYGGWLIPNENVKEIEEKIKEIFSFSKASELKSKIILESKRSYFYQLFEYLTTQGESIPIFCVVDKAYMVSAKIVETFFDPEYNSQISRDFTWNKSVKMALASFINSNKELLNDFSGLITHGTIALEKMRGIKEKIARHFMNANLIMASCCIKKLSDDNLTEMIKEFEVISQNGTQMRKLALIEPMLFNLIKNVNSIGKMFNCEINVIVDQLRGYNDVFAEMQTVCTKLGVIRKNSFINQADSKNEILLQTADLLSGYVERCIRKIDDFKNDEVSQKIWMKLINIREIYTNNQIVPWEIYGDGDFIKNFALLTGHDPQKVSSENYVDIIRTAFE